MSGYFFAWWLVFLLASGLVSVEWFLKRQERQLQNDCIRSWLNGFGGI